MKYFFALVSLSMFLTTGALAQSAICVKGACFEPQLAVGDRTLPLRGATLFRYMFFDIYSGGFYADPKVNTIPQALAPTPKRLELQYYRSLTKANFIESSEEMLTDNPQVNVSEIRKELDQLYTLYTDVEKGDRYALEYVPGVGTSLYLNGDLQGTIPGEKFQEAYFSIWISEHSVSDSFTSALLGK